VPIERLFVKIVRKRGRQDSPFMQKETKSERNQASIIKDCGQKHSWAGKRKGNEKSSARMASNELTAKTIQGLEWVAAGKKKIKGRRTFALKQEEPQRVIRQGKWEEKNAEKPKQTCKTNHTTRGGISKIAKS